MDWKARAQQAADEKAARDREAQRLRQEAETAKQIEAFGYTLSELLEQDIAVDALEATVHGVTFGWQHNPFAHSYEIVLQGMCPECGQSAWSPGVHSLADVGELLQPFKPRLEHVKQHLPPVTPYIRITPGLPPAT
jgi:hypothetical protein